MTHMVCISCEYYTSAQLNEANEKCNSCIWHTFNGTEDNYKDITLEREEIKNGTVQE